MDQDPGMWPEVAMISKEVLNIRYSFLPYLYTRFHMVHMHGGSIVRPIFSYDPSPYARDIDDQFMWGHDIMFAPVVEQGATSRKVYFPVVGNIGKYVSTLNE